MRPFGDPPHVALLGPADDARDTAARCHSEEPLHFLCHPERSEGSALVTLSSADVSIGAGYATRNLLGSEREPAGADSSLRSE
jgi:hypothetical protein